MSTVNIHTYASEGGGSVNCFAIESANHLILIDAQRQISQAKKFQEQLRHLGKPIVKIFITHEHPDHHAGIAGFDAAGVPVCASQATVEAIAKDELGFMKLSQQFFGEDVTMPVVTPSERIEDGQEVEIDGLRIRAYDLGPGESFALTAFELVGTGALFCGDLVANGMTPFLFEGRSRLWLEQLRSFSSRFPHIETLYCGHGQPAKAAQLVPHQIEYLERFQTWVRERATNGVLDDAQKAEIRDLVVAAYPGYEPVAEIPAFIENNAAAVAAELAATA